LSDTYSPVAFALRELQFIDSSGLSLLLATDDDARRDGWEFSVVDSCPAVSRVLTLSGLSGHFRRAEVPA
jgi:anti-anti-sigma factor